jgi:GNAT superfamily N-acetyltransferase
VSPAGAEIRPAVPDDLAGVLALYRQLNPDDPAPDPAAAARAWSALLSSGLTTPFVAEMAGRLVASCTLAIVPNLTRSARPYGVIENVVTDAGHRRAGLGRAVLRAALDRAWAANCYKVLLATGSKKQSTLRFYEGTGFVRDAKTYFEIRRP